jgi:hypothetical protein
MAGIQWVTIAPDDILGALNATEMRALSEAHVENGQTDPITAAIRVVIARVRGSILSWQHNQIDRDATLIPPELLDDAIWLVIQRLKLRFPAEKVQLTDAQKERIKTAEERLNKITTGDLRISAPLNPSSQTAQVSGGIEVISPGRRHFRNTNGLL